MEMNTMVGAADGFSIVIISPSFFSPRSSFLCFCRNESAHKHTTWGFETHPSLLLLFSPSYFTDSLFTSENRDGIGRCARQSWRRSGATSHGAFVSRRGGKV
jgi:hypothetical protein